MTTILRLLACSMLALLPAAAFAADPINNLEDVRIGVKLNGEPPTVAELLLSRDINQQIGALPASTPQ